MRRLGVLASGRGSNFRALLEASRSGKLALEIDCLICHVRDCGASSFAGSQGVPCYQWDKTKPPQMLREHLKNCDFVALAGFIQKIPPAIVQDFEGRMFNVHPAPLPEFGGQGMYGLAVHQAVLASGVRHSGPTVHLVSEEYDQGPILAHQAVPVLEEDTSEDLAARVLATEHQLYWRSIQDYIQSYG